MCFHARHDNKLHILAAAICGQSMNLLRFAGRPNFHKCSALRKCNVSSAHNERHTALGCGSSAHWGVAISQSHSGNISF